jgi:hypothetical protein
MEFTARDTPHQNSPVEVGFATLGGRARAMMSHANIPKHLKHLLLSDAVLTAILLDNLILIEINGKLATKYVHHAGKEDADPSFVHNLCTWGEAGTVTIKNRIMHPKSADRGVTCMFICYSHQHPCGTYRMWKTVTNGVHTTRDVTWLHRTYFPKLEAGEGSPAIDPDAVIDPPFVELPELPD